MTTTYTVIAPYVTVKINQATGGTVVSGFYEGGVLPPDADQEDVERLVRKEMVAESDSKQARFAAPAGTPKPGEPPNVAVTETPVSSLPLKERLKAQADAADKAKASPAKPAAKSGQ